MKILALLSTILALSLSACAQKPAESEAEAKSEPNISAKLDTTLPWLQIKIWEYQSKPVSNPPRSVFKTTFEGKPVYYVPPVCCDIPSELYAEDGKLMCYPSGGFTGAGDGRCKTFILDNPVRTPVWQDARQAVPVKREVPVLP